MQDFRMQLRERDDQTFNRYSADFEVYNGVCTKRMPAKQLVYTILALPIHHGHYIDSHRNPDQFAQSAFRTDGGRTFTGGTWRD